MARAGPRKIREYRLEFKWTAVRLSQQPGIQVAACISQFGHGPVAYGERLRAQLRSIGRRGEDRRSAPGNPMDSLP